MGRSIQQKFGPNARGDYTNASDPEITLRWSDVKDIVNWDTAPTSDADSGDPWFNAILMMGKADSDADTTESSNITVEKSFKTFQERGGEEKLGHVFSVTVYESDNTNDTPDSDNL